YAKYNLSGGSSFALYNTAFDEKWFCGSWVVFHEKPSFASAHSFVKNRQYANTAYPSSHRLRGN
ncbi:MAG: hypothetical protein K2J31_00140, partial [Alistipes sp.]|nr:hypothetical protein [Alistipes sp.]